MIWKGNKKWVYSMTYDEGCADLLRYARLCRAERVMLPYIEAIH